MTSTDVPESDLISSCSDLLYFILKRKDILRYDCIKLFSGLFFKNPVEIRDNPESLRDS